MPQIHYVAVDLETTGLDPQSDKIIEIAAIRIDAEGNILEEFHSLVNPGIKIPPIITHITGIKTDDVESAPHFSDIKDIVASFIGDAPILGHSVQFDVNFLESHGIPTNSYILDTFELAQTLLRKEPSYSLEILSTKYKLPHANKHRAKDDTLVAIELYKLLLQKIRELPNEHTEQIESILKRSTWSWGATILNVLQNPLKNFTENQTALKSKNLEERPAPRSTVLQQTLFEHLTNGQNSLIEAPDITTTDLLITAEHMTEQTGEHILILTPHSKNIQEDARVAILEHPDHYISRPLIETFLKKLAFTDAETCLALKLIPWLAETKTGLKSELFLSENEHPLWRDLSEALHIYETREPNPTTFYGQAFQNAKYRPITVISPWLFIENIVRQAPLFPSNKTHLIIDQIERFEDIVLSSLTNTFSLEDFTEKEQKEAHERDTRFAILFGLFGLLLENNPSAESEGGDLILEPHHFMTAQGAKIKAAINSLSEAVVNAPVRIQKHFNALQKALGSSPEILTWITQQWTPQSDGEIMVKACPRAISSLLKQHVWEGFASVHGITGYGTLNGTFDYLKRRLHLPMEGKNTWLETRLDPVSTSMEHPLSLILHPELPNVKVPANLTESAKLTTKILEMHDPKHAVFLLTNSIKAAEELYLKLLKPLENSGLQILTQGMTGGLGKISQRFDANPEGTLLIGTERLFSAILKTEDPMKGNATHIDTLLIHRLPFRFPWHPLVKAECAKAENAFKNYTLPEAILRFKQILYHFQIHATPHTIHLLDPRFDSYDGQFEASLPASVRL